MNLNREIQDYRTETQTYQPFWVFSRRSVSWLTNLSNKDKRIAKASLRLKNTRAISDCIKHSINTFPRCESLLLLESRHSFSARSLYEAVFQDYGQADSVPPADFQNKTPSSKTKKC